MVTATESLQQVRQKRAAALQGFEPLELAQHAGKRLLRFPTFDAALDEYFSKVREPQVEYAVWAMYNMPQAW